MVRIELYRTYNNACKEIQQTDHIQLGKQQANMYQLITISFSPLFDYHFVVINTFVVIVLIPVFQYLFTLHYHDVK